MYSYEDHKRAVELYIEYNLSAADVINELGYPDRHSLRNRYKDCLEHGGVRERTHEPRFYGDEAKRHAVEHFLGYGRSPSPAIGALGCPSKQSLYEWVDELAPGQRRIAPPSWRTIHLRAEGRRRGGAGHQEGLVAKGQKRKRRYSSYQGEISEAPENLVNRDFHADAPNRLWLTDITEFRIPAGKVRLSPVIDCFDGMAVSWRMSTAPNAELANSMLEAACSTLGEGEHPRIHSDRG